MIRWSRKIRSRYCGLLRRIKKELPDKNVWAYTGYVYDRDLVPGGKRFVDGVTRELLESIDILIDGRFVEELKNLMLNFRGSGNQRIIKMKETLETGKVVLSELNNWRFDKKRDPDLRVSSVYEILWT